MYPIYFFSIITNLLTGLFLVSTKEDGDIVSVIFNAKNWQKQGIIIVLAATTVLFGVLKLLAVTEGNVKFIGDIIPAFAGIIQGVLLFLIRGTSSNVALPRDLKTLISFRKTIGLGGIIVASLHILFHGVLFL